MKKKMIVALVMIMHSVGGITFAQSQSSEVILTEQKLVANDPTADAQFGAALAVDGLTAVIGAPAADGSVPNSGAAYVFQRESGVWTHRAKLIASDGAEADKFGGSVAIHDGIIVVGASGNDEAGPNSGAAYVFTGSGDTWTQADKLLPSFVGDTFFGFSVAVYSGTIAVGAPYMDSGFTNSGAVYLFEANAGGWSFTDRLATNTGGPVLSDLFGWDVALHEDLLVVGAYLGDTTYVYNRGPSDWEEVGTLEGDDTQANDRFGYAVGTDGTRIIVGAPHDDDAGINAGTAFLFVGEAGGWTQEIKLVPDAPSVQPGSHFGWAVDVGGSTIVVGAPNSKGTIDAEESGAAHLFLYDGVAWDEEAILTASDAAQFDHLGTDVAISDTTYLAGAPDHDEQTDNVGAVYAFTAAEDSAEPQICVAEEQSTEEVFPGAILTWDSALRCENAPDEGIYQFSVLIQADQANTALAVVDAITLTHTTPRPLDQPPQATVDEVTGLPFTLAAGEVQTFTVTGTYELARPGAAKIANLHFCATGHAESTGEPFYLGLNTFLRGPGSEDDGGGSGPPPLPVISNAIASPGPTSATISWQTDQPATSAVMFYPTGFPALEHTVNRGCLAVLNHQIQLDGLVPLTEYTFQVQSQSGIDGVATSEKLTFTTTDYVRIFIPFVNR